MEKKSVKELEKALHVEEDEEVMLPGFRFHPTDEELVAFYLQRKVEKKTLSIEIIKQVDIYKFDPWDLPKASTVGGEKEWYFFCLRGRKYRNSIRPNRVTGSGFWKATGIDRPIYSAGDTGDCIGLKKSLVYYRGSAGKGTKTDWMMHEFRLPPPPATENNDSNSIPAIQEAEIWTICRIFMRNVTNKKFPQYWREANSKKMTTESSSKTSSSLESDAGDDYKCFVASNATQQLYPHGDLRLMSNYFDDKSQLLIPGQWNNPMPPPQTPSTVMHQSIVPNPQMVEFFKDGNWDELGRMMEIMSETNQVYECRYI